MSVTIEQRGFVGVIWLDEPQTRHALSITLVQSMLSAFDNEAIQASRAIVIASSRPYFCAGANIDDLRNYWMQGNAPETEPGRLFERLASDTRPVIAAVDGGAIGGGFELMLSCDLAVAGQDAWFCLPELQHGVIPNTALQRLQQMVGLRTMLFHAFTGDKLSAQQALAMGAVNEVVSAGQAVTAAAALAQRIVERAAPEALAVAKRYAQRYAQTDWLSVDHSLRELPADEWQEGLTAFTERRQADFNEHWQMARANASFKK